MLYITLRASWSQRPAAVRLSSAPSHLAEPQADLSCPTDCSCAQCMSKNVSCRGANNDLNDPSRPIVVLFSCRASILERHFIINAERVPIGG